MKIWYPMLVYLAIQAITPGPNNLTCLFLGGKYGLKGSMRFISGSMTGLFAKTLLCGLLNLVLYNVMPTVSAWLKWIGAAYMLYLAYCMCVSGWKGEEENESGSYESTVASGLMLQLLNGKSWIAAISLFSVYVIPVSTEFKAILFASVCFTVICFCCSVLWTLFGTGLKNFIAKYRKPFGIVMGLSMIWCAVNAII